MMSALRRIPQRMAECVLGHTNGHCSLAHIFLFLTSSEGDEPTFGSFNLFKYNPHPTHSPRTAFLYCSPRLPLLPSPHFFEERVVQLSFHSPQIKRQLSSMAMSLYCCSLIVVFMHLRSPLYSRPAKYPSLEILEKKKEKKSFVHFPPHSLFSPLFHLPFPLVSPRLPLLSQTPSPPTTPHSTPSASSRFHLFDFVSTLNYFHSKKNIFSQTLTSKEEQPYPQHINKCLHADLSLFIPRATSETDSAQAHTRYQHTEEQSKETAYSYLYHKRNRPPSTHFPTHFSFPTHPSAPPLPPEPCPPLPLPTTRKFPPPLASTTQTLMPPLPQQPP